jgi:NADP-dependent 3-hydroxy acid dehydrogenase YdfG
VAETEAHFGRLDILVNNAGVMLLAPVDAAEPADWRRMLELNVLGLMVSSQAALAGMRARGGGHIVNISSTAGRLPNANISGYSASKFGVYAFSESLRKEVYKDGIRVSVIEPGVVATELRDHIPHAPTQKALNAWADSMRQLQPEDIANAVLYCVTQPTHVNVNEILIRPTDQER